MYWARPLAVATTTTKAVGEEQPNPLSRPCETEHKVGSTNQGGPSRRRASGTLPKEPKKAWIVQELFFFPHGRNCASPSCRRDDPVVVVRAQGFNRLIFKSTRIYAAHAVSELPGTGFDGSGDQPVQWRLRDYHAVGLVVFIPSGHACQY